MEYENEICKFVEINVLNKVRIEEKGIKEESKMTQNMNIRFRHGYNEI